MKKQQLMRKNLRIIALTVAVFALVAVILYDVSDKKLWRSWNFPLSGKIIVLDPGHGGPDGGAGYGDAEEKDIALAIALKLRDYLQEQGALVIMTREEDKDLAAEDTRGLSRRKAEDLRKRLQMINESDADLFVSIHLNAITSSRWRGAQTFYFPRYPENERAAKFIQAELRRNLENTHRKARPIRNVYIMEHAKRPGVLVEAGFLSNPAERAELKTSKYQNKVAASIYKGILRYFTSEKELSE